MARPRSDVRQGAILDAAVEVIARRGLGAATAMIAKEAGISNGSLFTYFDTKADLLNRLYVELKAEMAEAALENVPDDGDLRERMRQIWRQWLYWGAASPQKRRALAHLAVAEEITADSRAKGERAMQRFAQIVEQGRARGVLKDAPLEFAMRLLNAIAETTMDRVIQQPSDADMICDLGFETVWRVLT